ncbi:MAG: SPFH domain-containing protein [Clostridia bacterium]|nr:SPFH domain-containing protein [Clostridia bacterium]
MGLIKAITGAVGGVFADQWREFFYCESMDVDVLVRKGQKRTGKRSSNTRGEENIISNGSIVAVNEGQFMMIVDQGKVVEFSGEPGEYIYDTSTTPSMLYGGFGAGLVESFKEVGKRFTMGGDPGKDQRVYFFNTKELVGNKYGTPNAVPFRVIDKNIGLDIDIAIRCHGEYSYKIVNPLLFYTNVCGNVDDEYRRDVIDGQLKSELMTALQPAFAKISEMGIRYSALPGHTMELADALNQVLSEKWTALRGLAIASFGINSLKASDEDEALIKQLQRNAVMRDPTMAAATLVGAQSEAMVNAAKNEGAGPVMAFAGMNMAGQAGGMNAQNLFAMGANQPKAETPASDPNSWTCSCGAVNKGKFCTECAKPRPVANVGWTCSCGAVNKGKFCSECGKPKPAGAKQYKCDKCGWEVKEGEPTPKFCPECGDAFDDSDVVK